MGMTKRPQIGHDGTSGQEMTYDEVSQCLQGGQGQVSGPQLSLLCGMRYRAQIGHEWNMGLKIEIDQVIQPHRGDQGQVRGNRMPASLWGMLHRQLPLS